MTDTHYFIGVDGGGSYSKAVLVDQNLNVLSHAKGDSLNFYSIGFKQAKENFSALIQTLLAGYESVPIHTVFIGMSAVDTEVNGPMVDSLVDGIIKPQHVYMQSDLYVALMGHTFGKAGLMLVAGTGSMAVALDEQEKEYCYGGYGYLIGDQGSAYSIASQAIRDALLAFEGIAPKTTLQACLLQYFKIQNHRDIIGKLYPDHNPRKTIASFAEQVTAEAKKGDATAIRILSEAAQYLAKLASALIQKTNIRHLESIGISGGVFENDTFIRQAFNDAIHQEYPALQILFPQYSPEMGAAIAAVSRYNHLATVDYEMLKIHQREEATW